MSIQKSNHEPVYRSGTNYKRLLFYSDISHNRFRQYLNDRTSDSSEKRDQYTAAVLPVFETNRNQQVRTDALYVGYDYYA